MKPQRWLASILVLAIAAAATTSALAQHKRIPARLIYYTDERYYGGQLYIYSSPEEGCEILYSKRLAKSVESGNWSHTWTESCGTFTQSGETFRTGAAYWLYGTDQYKPGYGSQCYVPVRSIERLVGPQNCGYTIGNPRSDITRDWMYAGPSFAYVCPSSDWIYYGDKTCVLPYADPYPPQVTPKCGNPVATGSGCKLETIPLLALRTGSSPINLELRYAALYERAGGRLVGHQSWFLEPLDRRLLLPPTALYAGVKLTAVRPDGGFEEFTADGQGNYASVNPGVTLAGLSSGWRLTDFDARVIETYDAVGRLQEFARFDGSYLRVTYEDGSTPWPTLVETSSGVNLQFQRSAAALTAVIAPDGLPTSLQYATASVQGLTYSASYLSSVTFADGTRRSFEYKPADLAANLPISDSALYSKLVFYSAVPPFTGMQVADFDYIVQGRAPMVLGTITDELNQPYARFEYDTRGRATLSEHIGGVGRYTFSYPSPLSTVVTEPLGATNNFNFQNANGRNLLAGISRQGPNNLYSGHFYYYDTAGNLRGLMSNTGNVTHCVNTDPVLGKETARVEGMPYGVQCTFDLRTYTIPAGTIQRKVLTDWNTEWRLPTRRSEPKKLTTWTYHGQGGNCAPATLLSNGKAPPVLCSMTEQATSDENGGLGFVAATVGMPRTWNFTYTTYGRLLTITDPNGKTTQYAYYADNHVDVGKRGNIASVTNAVNHATQITDYTPNGQPTRIVDANGQATVYNYDARQRLTGQTVGTEQTRFDYDLAGQLVRVAMPDGAQLAYTYDAAHRLTEVADHRGNKLTYTLDVQGNRIGEKVTDPMGALVRDVARVMDAFSRVKQLTGVQ